MALETEKINGGLRSFVKLIESADDFSEGARGERVIAVKENEVFSSRLFDTGITGLRKAGIGLDNKMNAGIFLGVLTTNRGGGIGGTVIDENDLVVGKILA